MTPPDLLSPRRPGTAGFSLLEVLVALIIFALAFGALASLFQTAFRQSKAADDLRRATELAETQLARIGRDLPLQPGHREGRSPEGIRWRAEIVLEAEPDQTAGIALYRVHVEAGPGDGIPDLVSLTTLSLGPLR